MSKMVELLDSAPAATIVNAIMSCLMELHDEEINMLGFDTTLKVDIR